MPAIGLAAGVINPAEYIGVRESLQAGTADDAVLDADKPVYAALEPTYIADAIIHAIDQPWGVSIGDITVRATGDRYIL